MILIAVRVALLSCFLKFLVTVVLDNYKRVKFRNVSCHVLVPEFKALLYIKFVIYLAVLLAQTRCVICQTIAFHGRGSSCVNYKIFCNLISEVLCSAFRLAVYAHHGRVFIHTLFYFDFICV